MSWSHSWHPFVLVGLEPVLWLMFFGQLSFARRVGLTDKWLICITSDLNLSQNFSELLSTELGLLLQLADVQLLLLNERPQITHRRFRRGVVSRVASDDVCVIKDLWRKVATWTKFQRSLKRLKMSMKTRVKTTHQIVPRMVFLPIVFVWSLVFIDEQCAFNSTWIFYILKLHIFNPSVLSHPTKVYRGCIFSSVQPFYERDVRARQVYA